MAGEVCIQVARGLLLYGSQIADGDMTRKDFLEEIGVNESRFRAAAERIGAVGRSPGLRFFDATGRERIVFGPGAGLVLGVSLGAQSLRAALVDANGNLHYPHRAPARPDQLSIEPRELLDRVRDALDAVMRPALEDKELLVEDALPFLGVSIAWPAPVNRQKVPFGNSLANGLWHNGEPLDQRVADHLGIERARSHAINDAAAAAIAIAHKQTTTAAHADEEIPKLAMVLRLSGGVGAATIVVESPKVPKGRPELKRASGFERSILTGGLDHFAGEIGHVPVSRAAIAAINRKGRPDGLEKLRAQQCSCGVEITQGMSEHLEAYVGAPAIAARVGPGEAVGKTIERIVESPQREAHKQALEDAASLVANALVGPVAMLNPATIVLTGPLANTVVRDVIKTDLAKVHTFGTQPGVDFLRGEENEFVRVKGAALAVLRRQVFRKLPSILGGTKPGLPGRVRSVTAPLTETPW